jgi:hypothetical protein
MIPDVMAEIRRVVNFLKKGCLWMPEWSTRQPHIPLIEIWLRREMGG